MKKRLLATIPVLLVVFLCSFPAYAVTSGGKTIVSSSYSYNDGDVTTYVRVNGHYNDSQYTGGDRIYSYQHSFTVTLANNTNEFQVADSNSFTVDLYTGYSDTFAATTTNTPSGSEMYRPSWGSEVTSYSDNMSAPRILMYPSGDNAGHVLISFSDSDLLILNPNETREYNFTINFNMGYDGINQYPINGNYLYSYFTYVGSVSMYSRPSGFTSNTIEDFINNDSVPDSIIAWLIANYDIVSREYPNIASFIGNAGNSLYNHQYNMSNTPFSASYRIITEPAHITSYDFEIDASAQQGGDNTVYCIPVTVIAQFFNNSNTTYQSNSLLFNANLDYSVPSGYKLVGYEHTIDSFDGINLYNFYNKQMQFRLSNIVNNKYVLPIGKLDYIVLKINYYLVKGSYDTNIDIENVPTIDFTLSSYDSLSFSTYSQTLFGSISKNFADIRDRLQSILDSYNTNQPQASTNTNDSNSATSDINTQHNVEAQYYAQTNTNLANTGLSNFNFDNGTSAGLSVVKDQFTIIWNKLDVYNSVFNFSLMLSIALMIIRHIRPIRRKSND